MMEEYEAVMVLRGKIARGEISLEDALKGFAEWRSIN